MIKNISLLVFVFFALSISGCSNEQKVEKAPFYIKTQKIGDFSKSIVLTKPGRVSGTEEIVVNSQVAGRVSKIIKNEGNVVMGGQPIISLSDSVASYGLQVQRSKNAFDRAVLQYSQNTTNLDKSIKDAEISLDMAKNTYQTTQQIVDQNIKRANLDRKMSSIQVENLGIQFLSEKKSLLNSLDSILHQVDTYLGVTDKYKSYNDNYEIYLGAKNTTQKSNTESNLLKLYKQRDELKNITGDDSSNIDQLYQNVLFMDDVYNNSNAVLDGMRAVLLDTISSVSLSQTSIDGYKYNIDGLKSTLQLSYAGFVAYRKQISSIRQDGTGATLAVSDEQANINYDIALVNNQNSVFASEIGVKNAINYYNNLINTRDEQVGLLENNIIDGQLSYQDSLTRFNKLSIRAPIYGVIGTIFVDNGQEVSPGTPMFTIINNKSQILDIFVDIDELSLIYLSQEAQINYYDKLYSGSVVSISSVAEKNGLYKVVVALETGVDLIGGIATVNLKSIVSNPLLPVNVVSVLAENTGFITVLDGTGLVKYIVSLGDVWSDNIEILSMLPYNMEIVTSDISNFDFRKYNLIKSD